MSDTSENPNRCYAQKASEEPSLFHNGTYSIQLYHIGWLISIFFTLVACGVSFWLIDKHLQWYTNKREQRHIVRLLFMVPIYAVISLASFLFWTHATPMILIRDAYESTVLTSFFYLLLAYLSPSDDRKELLSDPDLDKDQIRQLSKEIKKANVDKQKAVFIKYGLSYEADRAAIVAGKPVQKWVFPLGFIKWKPNDGLYFLQWMKWGVLQYCVIKPGTAFAAVILDYIGLYCESSWSPKWGYVYVTILVSISVTIAMYCLIQLYVCVSVLLAPQRPLLKLFSIKAVVFLTFWQATALSGLSTLGVVKDTKNMTAEDINIGFSALLETFEMMIFAFIHVSAFTYRPYRLPISDLDSAPDISKRTPKLRSLGHALDFRETFRELWAGWLYMLDRMRGRPPRSDQGALRVSHFESAFGRPRAEKPNENAGLLQDGQWLGIGDRDTITDKYGYRVRTGKIMREKSDTLELQIARELGRRGITTETNIDPRGHIGIAVNEQQGYTHKPQRSWWRNVYNRVSNSGDPPEVQEDIQEIRLSPPPVRASRRQRETAAHEEMQETQLSPPPVRASRRHREAVASNSALALGATSDGPSLLLQPDSPVRKSRTNKRRSDPLEYPTPTPITGPANQNGLLVEYDYFYDCDDENQQDDGYEQDVPPPPSTIRPRQDLGNARQKQELRPASPPAANYSAQFAYLQRQTESAMQVSSPPLRIPEPVSPPRGAYMPPRANSRSNSAQIQGNSGTGSSRPQRMPEPVSPARGSYMPRRANHRNDSTRLQGHDVTRMPEPASPPRPPEFPSAAPQIRRPMRNNSGNLDLVNISNIAQPSFSGTSAVTRYPDPSNARYSQPRHQPEQQRPSLEPQQQRPRANHLPSKLVFPEPLAGSGR